MTSVSGIYVIIHKKSGKIYLGKARNIKRRWNDHKRELTNGEHHNRHLQSAWNKYGEKAFQFKILEYCPTEKLNEREKHYIAFYRPLGMTYNQTDGGDGQLNPSDETRQRMSESAKQRIARQPIVFSDEVRHKMSESAKRRKGSKKSPAFAAKIAAARRGCKHSDETRRKLSEAAKRREARKRAERDKSE